MSLRLGYAFAQDDNFGDVKNKQQQKRNTKISSLRRTVKVTMSALAICYQLARSAGNLSVVTTSL
jgi:hypothetical protein